MAVVPVLLPNLRTHPKINSGKLVCVPVAPHQEQRSNQTHGSRSMFGLERWLGAAKGGNVKGIKQVKRQCSALADMLAEQQRRLDALQRQDQAQQQEHTCFWGGKV